MMGYMLTEIPYLYFWRWLKILAVLSNVKGVFGMTQFEDVVVSYD